MDWLSRLGISVSPSNSGPTMGPSPQRTIQSSVSPMADGLGRKPENGASSSPARVPDNTGTPPQTPNPVVTPPLPPPADVVSPDGEQPQENGSSSPPTTEAVVEPSEADMADDGHQKQKVKRGRPKKHKPSDEEEHDDDEEKMDTAEEDGALKISSIESEESPKDDSEVKPVKEGTKQKNPE